MMDDPERSIADVLSDFFSDSPTLEAIADYRFPDDLQARAHTLLDKNSGEREAMAEILMYDHLMTLVKAKARIRLQQKSAGSHSAAAS